MGAEAVKCPGCGAAIGDGEPACGYCGAARAATPAEAAATAFLVAQEERLRRGRDRYQGRLVAGAFAVLCATVGSWIALAAIGVAIWSRLAAAVAVFLLGFVSFGFAVIRLERRGMDETYRLEVGPEVARYAHDRAMGRADLEGLAVRVLPAKSLLRAYLFGGVPQS